jgi:hypothetical protein
MTVYGVLISAPGYGRYYDSLWATKPNAAKRRDQLLMSMRSTAGEPSVWLVELDVPDAELREATNMQKAAGGEV